MPLAGDHGPDGAVCKAFGVQRHEASRDVVRFVSVTTLRPSCRR